uniref:Uncharacterized protein n=1 Tax=Placozoa sp. H17 HM-2017 TaxID=2017600 RepID=A0A7I6N618_9METZ|nr:hypothetical protein [Placozoa sp. H17 HM-2017]
MGWRRQRIRWIPTGLSKPGTRGPPRRRRRRIRPGTDQRPTKGLWSVNRSFVGPGPEGPRAGQSAAPFFPPGSPKVGAEGAQFFLFGLFKPGPRSSGPGAEGAGPRRRHRPTNERRRWRPPKRYLLGPQLAFGR